ncbi:MAG: hypothetical protein LBJ11_09180 [Oscillospiraceae bacterium]|jgi:hypothetical protein|nr:hypothetical protein [Oscillospiraceae bacterium]
MTSPDGITWTHRRNTLPQDYIMFRSVCYANGIFIAVGSGSKAQNPNTLAMSVDGISWTYFAPPAYNQWNGVDYGNGVFVAVSSSGTNNRVMLAP